MTTSLNYPIEEVIWNGRKPTPDHPPPALCQGGHYSIPWKGRRGWKFRILLKSPYSKQRGTNPRSPINVCQEGGSTHRRQCSLRWTRALRNSSRWCDPWRSASSEASLRSTASADCLLTWKQYLKLRCCHTAGAPRSQPCSLTPHWHREPRKPYCAPGDLSHFPSLAHSAWAWKGYHVILEVCQNALHVWIKNFPEVLLFFSPINCRVLHWAVQPLGHRCLLQILTIQDTLIFNFFFFLKALHHRQNLFCPLCRLQLSFMPLQDMCRKLSPPSPAALKAHSSPAQSQAAAYKNLWGLLSALNWCGFLTCNWDCMDTDPKLPLFSPWQQS